MGTKLNDMQQRILRFLLHAQGRGYRPSTAEIRDAVGLSSTFAVRKELDDLRTMGFIARNPQRPEDIVVAPDDDLRAVWSEPPVHVPLLGAIAAGRPVLTEENIEEEFWLPRELVGYADNLFMLRTHGESMVEAGIRDGDYVVVHRQSNAAHDDVVVARLGDETTVKRLYARGGQVRLLPANPDFEPIEVTGEVDAELVGKVVTVIRTL
jgi:repressor LexA